MFLTTYVTALAKTPMVDEIVIYASFVIIAVVSVLLYIMAISDWLLSLLNVKRHGAPILRDRGIKKFTYPEGRSVVYEPAGFDNRFLKKYMLFVRDENKYLKCLFADRVRSAYCELFVFDNQNRLIKTVDLFLEPNGDRYSDAIALPTATSHVSILVMKVNGRAVKMSTVDAESFKRHLWGRRGLFALLTVSVTVLEGLILTSLVRYFLDIFMEDRFSMTFAQYVGSSGRIVDIAISLLAGICVAAIGIALHLRKDRT
ncbi:MAG: hypothetical protein IJW52_00470 [Clostridia bacterium]|nr:hypothetical protein [Clostridia bacterium]